MKINDKWLWWQLYKEDLMGFFIFVTTIGTMVFCYMLFPKAFKITMAVLYPFVLIYAKMLSKKKH